MKFVARVLTEAIKELYPKLGAVLIATIMFMIIYQYAEKTKWKSIFRELVDNFKSRKHFRKVFFLAFYIFVVLFQTVLCRGYRNNPLEVVIGEWFQADQWGNISTEPIGNIFLFLPMIPLLFATFPEKFFHNKEIRFLSILWKAVIISLLSSLTIEIIQLVFRLGTFQLSDLCFNTLGGILGGIIYYIVYRWKHRGSKEKK